MYFQSFERIINELYSYYRLKNQPDQETLQQWFVKVKTIPTEAGAWISNWFKSEFDSLPWNIPKTFLEGWYLYRRENPQKIISAHSKTDCRDCYGEGIIWFKCWSPDVGRMYEYPCRCGSCENWRRHVGALALPARWTLAELKNMEVEIVGRVENRTIRKADPCEAL